MKPVMILGCLLFSSGLLFAGNAGHVVGWGGISLPYEPGSVFTNIGAGWDHGMAIRNDGKLFIWGNNWNGQAYIPPGLSNVIAAAGGEEHTLALTADGQVHTWGWIYPAGQAVVPSGLSNIVAIAAAGDTDLALKNDGTVVAWGNNYNGQTNVPPDLTNVIAIAAESSSSLALKSDGTVVEWGVTNLPDGLTNVIAISCGDYHSLALRADGSIIAWGDSYGATNMLDVPAGLTNVVAIAAGGDMSYALKSDGTVVGWGADWANQVSGATNLTHVVAIAAGYDFAVALRDDGSLVGWGENDEGESLVPGAGALDGISYIGGVGYGCIAATTNGQVIDWGAYYYYPPDQPAGLSNVIAVASGWYNYLALETNESVTGWGSDDYGQASQGSNLVNVVAISAAGNVSMACQSDGTVACWGHIGSPPTALSHVVAVAAGSGGYVTGPADGFALALRSDGRVFGWGNNGNGQATPPTDLTNAVAIAAGAFFGLALKTDGTVVGWGDDSYGQSTPPPGLSNVVAIAAGFQYSLALKNDGTVVAWGENDSNQTNVPATLDNVTAISGGSFNVCLAIEGDGSPVLTTQPTNVSAFTGETVTLSTMAVSSMPLDYRWQFNGTDLNGATNGFLTLSGVSFADAGQYSCIVSNTLGVVTNFVCLGVADHPPTSFDPSTCQLAADGFHLRLTGLTAHGSVIIYESTNLTDWEGIFTNPPSIGKLDFVDANATNSAQFYRAAEGP